MSAPGKQDRALLDPIDRLSEILFGLIMALTFTGSISVASQGREEIRTLLIGAIGCNTAWGIVDAVMYLLTTLTERGRSVRSVRAIREAPDAGTARRLMAEVLPPGVAALLDPSDYDRLRDRLGRLDPLPPRSRLVGKDFLGALVVFLLVFLSTVPVVIPFVFLSEPRVALRASNGVALTLLFGIGFLLGRQAGGRGFLLGLTMVGVGVVLVLVTIALGG